jgi:hypothetical protein
MRFEEKNRENHRATTERALDSFASLDAPRATKSRDYFRDDDNEGGDVRIGGDQNFFPPSSASCRSCHLRR